jgi:hypothetical protein
VELGNKFVEFLGHISKDPVKMSDWKWTTGKLNDAGDQNPGSDDPGHFSKILVTEMLLNYKNEPYPKLKRAYLDLLLVLVDNHVAHFLNARGRRKQIHADDVVLDPLVSQELQKQAALLKITFTGGPIWLSKASFDKFVDDIVTKITGTEASIEFIKQIISMGEAEWKKELQKEAEKREAAAAAAAAKAAMETE